MSSEIDNLPIAKTLDENASWFSLISKIELTFRELQGNSSKLNEFEKKNQKST